MGKKGRPAGKKSSQNLKPTAKTTASQPPMYNITRFFVRSTPAALKQKNNAEPAQVKGTSSQKPQPGHSQKVFGKSTLAATLVVDAVPPVPAISPPKQVESARNSTPLPLQSPSLPPPKAEPLSEACAPVVELMMEQLAKRPRTSGGMSFLLSQNDGDDSVVWRTSPLPQHPLPAVNEGELEARNSSGFARGGPAGFSGRSSPLPAVRHMLSTASMLKKCGNTTSPPDAKPMSSVLDQWLQPQAQDSTISPQLAVLASLDVNRENTPYTSQAKKAASDSLLPAGAEEMIMVAKPAVAAQNGLGSSLTKPQTNQNPFKRWSLTGKLAIVERPAPVIFDGGKHFLTPSRPKKKVLLELLDRVESAVRQRRQSGGSLDLRSLVFPMDSRCAFSCDEPANPGFDSVRAAFRRKAAGPCPGPVPERSECERESQETREAGNGAALQAIEAGTNELAMTAEVSKADLGVSADDIAQLQESFGLQEWDWQDEKLLQEVRRACEAAEDRGTSTPVETGPLELVEATEGKPLTAEKETKDEPEVEENMQARPVVQLLHSSLCEGKIEADRMESEGTGCEVKAKVEEAQHARREELESLTKSMQSSKLDSALLQQRFCVREAIDREVEVGCQSTYEKVLRVVNDFRGDMSTVVLRDSWVDTPIEAGDRVSVIGDFEEDPSTRDSTCIVSAASSLLIHHPDMLIKGSKVGTGMACIRRSVLEERLHGSDMGAAALLGTLVHSLFQAAISSGDTGTEALEEEAWLLVQQNKEKLYAAGENEQSALAHLSESIPAIQKWAHDFLGISSVQMRDNEVNFGVAGKLRTSVTEVLDIEERVWSPRYGLKGMIDVSMRVATSGRGPPHSALMPFELKTGKKTSGYTLTDHRAQVILYTLLMTDRYEEDVQAGLLFYSHTGQSLGVPVQRGELVSLVMNRNSLACALLAAEKSDPDGCALPPIVDKINLCRNCPQLEACAVYQQASKSDRPDCGADEMQVEPFGNEIVATKSSHLQDRHVAFFRHWEYLLNKETEDTQSDMRALWGQSGHERQAAGQCLAGLKLVGLPAQLNGGGKEQRMVYHFQPLEYNAMGGPLQEGEYVLLSTEGERAAVALANGNIVSKDASGIRVSFPSVLRLPAGRGLSGADRLEASTWRLDKVENAYHSNLARTNLVRLMAASGDSRRRAMIVEGEAPVFDMALLSSQDPALEYCRKLTHINDDQRRALMQVLTAQDYCMVLGMPGTGKTTTICHAVRALLARGSSVLVTSHTNSAVDNILMKLKEQGVDFLRVGKEANIHAEVRKQALDAPENAPSSVAALEARVTAARVLGVTCLGVTHPLFSKRTFDVCIVDEASQITLPECLGPLQCARMFVLVGDHNQLPPLVKSRAAREGGLDVSLFKLLSDAHPEAVAALETQYRMNADIMLLSNTLVYDNRLRCASSTVADSRLSLATEFVGSQGSTWLRSAIDPLRRVVFLDTDSLGGAGQEVRQQEAVHNMAEASLVIKVINALREGGISPVDIGVISPYQAQVKLIGRLTAGLAAAGLEVHTVDKYQGRDKDCIIVSFVRSNQDKAAGNLLRDARRINVALTRAKKKLILIGSGSTLSSVPLLKELMRLVLDNRWLVCMPAGLLSQKRIEVPKDDASALLLAAHLQESLSQKETKEKAEEQTASDQKQPARFAPKGKVWKAFQRAAESKGAAQKRKPLQQISGNAAAGRSLH